MHHDMHLVGWGLFGGGFVLFVLAALASIVIIAVAAVFLSLVGIILDG